MKVGKSIATILIVVASLFCLTGCFDFGDDSDMESVQVVSANMTYEYLEYSEKYDAKITGKIKNLTNKQLSYIMVEFSIYDANGSLIGSALDSINNLGAYETWAFEATSLGYFANKPVSFKLKDVTSW